MSDPIQNAYTECRRRYGNDWYEEETMAEDEDVTEADVARAVLAAARERLRCYPEDALLKKLVELAERGAAS